MAKAVQALQSKNVNRIILTRPAVEAGEQPGFLPGTLSEKIDPYLRPLYDALHDMIDPPRRSQAAGRPGRSVAPLAYMRGRSLNDAFIILDEAQNTSPEQMKMFLTRLGFGSKIVVTGDVTQVDLPNGTKSGLRVIEGILDGVEDIVFNRLTSHDVVRHKLVGEIVAAYDEFDARGERGRRSPPARPRRGTARMSIEVLNEVRARARRHRARLVEPLRDGAAQGHPLAELCIKAVDEQTIAQLNEQWMEKRGPTDVLAFPMDELRPGLVNGKARGGRARRPGLCPEIAARQGETAGHGTNAEIELLTVHGILLLGYDHAEAGHREMFGLQDELLAAWRAAAPTYADDLW